MKRYIVMILAALMAVSIIGCGQSGDLFPESTAGDTAQTEPVDEAGMKVGYLLPSGTDTTDTDSRIEGIRQMQYETGLKDSQVFIRTDVSRDDCASRIEELVQEGCNIIFACDDRYENTVLDAAQQYPDVQFCHATGYQAKDAGLDNFHNYFASIYEGRYLAGIAAGLKTETNKLGYVAAFPFAEVISGYTAFYLGAKSVNPDVTMEIMYTNSWNDPTVESQVAKALIDRGCDVISQHSDSTAPATTAEDNGVWQVGYNNDMIEAAPNASLISPRIDWGIYVTEAVQAMIDGEEIPVDWCKGLADGAVYLSPLNENIAAEGTQEAIDEAAEKIRSGELHVFAGPLKGVSPDGEEYEVAEGEYYHEQEEASAPSWLYIVDGCTVVE